MRIRRRRVGRFIPACAGNILSSASMPAMLAVHPRVCGEHVERCHEAGQRAGSSPRVRGTLSNGRFCRCFNRFIPACAGNIGKAHVQASKNTVHPRVCGEHNARPSNALDFDGSSPRVRGTCVVQFAAFLAGRFIPACAGNIDDAPAPPIIGSVHPRVCGEHLSSCALSWPRCGSSPRVRGTLGVGARSHQKLRFIPACAGNITCAPVRLSTRSVHPRVCGEHAFLQKLVLSSVGSSPRVRGTWMLTGLGMRPVGFIPACAGNIEAPTTPPDSLPVHPRVCGEHEQAITDEIDDAGSSPRVRGTCHCRGGERWP